MVMRISRIIGFNANKNSTNGHETHFQTIFYDDQGHAHHIIFKKNKYHGELGQKASELEASFSALANLFGAPHRALKQNIITNEQDEIIGVASEHAAHMLLKIRTQTQEKIAQTSKQLSSVNELSQEELNAWLAGYKPILTEQDRWKKTSLAHEFAMSMQRNILEHEARMDNYFSERKKMGLYKKELDEKYLSQLIHYCQQLVSKGKNLNLDEVPQEFKHDIELLHMAYDKKMLEFKCDRCLKQNITQAMELSFLDAGKGFNFLDKVPQNFFAQLMIAKKEGKVNLDMDSLADVLTTAYGLEEDDLHKGNIGYYVSLQEKDKPCVHFFKIDNDLMFVNKLMASRNGARFANWGYTKYDFAITSRDLSGFPDLQDSGNHYWPTKKALLSKGSKAYQNYEDREAYKSLKNDPEFKKAKWQRFLKQIVMPHDLIVSSLQQPLTALNDPHERQGTLSLVQRAVAARMNELRLRLISIPEFRQFLTQNHQEAKALILSEMKQHAQNLGCSKEEMATHHFEAELALDTVLIASALYSRKKIMHTAIMTQGYRCYDTALLLKKNMNTRDEDGLTPLDYAIEQYEIYSGLQKEAHETNKMSYQKMIRYYADVLCDLDREKAEYTLLEKTQYKALITQAQKENSISQLPVVSTLDEYKMVLEHMRAQPMRTLKQDKVSAIALLEKAQLSTKDLQQLKEELASSKLMSPLKFIKELRSEIWLIKLIRGAYGITSTLNSINETIQIKMIAQSSLNASSPINVQHHHSPK
jgi:hypothetical protein